ncbi:conserved hypothetical protein [Bradyrhizobium sp. ORS 375]|uniref:AbiJ-NTD4 domain-containing protein n=1 Tax=Bradyrhizobium sp. (strain ORS 375) TaxID=566679 RepID=UPI0002406990|nr:hypothetical protein [Bradyrhizobium sp. ORS 375]CCD94654.1 conserved hypothetical protein [Bradyrhizobium sp. ORS 375]
MLTDIFAHRYLQPVVWDYFTEESRRLITQGYQLLNQICPYYIGGHEDIIGRARWQAMHDSLARELGLQELSPSAWGYFDAQKFWRSGFYPVVKMCETWMLATFDGTIPADRFIKERLSLVEIGFRFHESWVAQLNADLPKEIAQAKLRDQRRGGIGKLSASVDNEKAKNAAANLKIQTAVIELNARFRQAGCKLHYHNGFIQFSEDQKIGDQIETPFWTLVAAPKWRNVDHDMKEAIDLRDTGGRDAAMYAAKSLESTIKIISDEKNLTNGKEKGAANFVDNLRGAQLIEVWETDMLKLFFSKVRNPLGHGPGSAPMPSLTEPQTDWAIEQSMIWIKSLIRRL